MKLLKTKFPPKPESRFEEFLCSQPVFNWFDKYEKKGKKAVSDISDELDKQESWIAKSTS